MHRDPPPGPEDYLPYLATSKREQKSIVVVNDTPYPDASSRGIVTALPRRFEPQAKVVVDETKPMLKAGGESSTYVVSW